ncbi:homocysteine S-methyltransferase [Streptomyces alkaliterrae]|uniref:Homocysteine S-methyltransferase n=1 Tax=Streptomyces alkaliterrae TaxID=2213162 RepID=A0A5P0YQ15_9ACTN|nr:homocysteine S-methyltransferase [Streptomyces alkaliterrae]MBB1252781.1 homocysteine S-methyltransferase [Streptomyces alkaliterrae]MBB1259146.1 homocysteine S-methyltransferase [Streptomyces alkaliterrae]MQS01697.1 homocysteine S-methyltransferase [Streptomyces alkaliterrae]
MPRLPLAEALARSTVVLDGGLSNQLAAQGADLSGDLWSARLLDEAPHQLRTAHRAYVEAGARVLITASYQASFRGFARHGLDHRAARRLFARSVELAREAAGRTPVWVAASVGPYGAVLADGSEYRGRYGLSTAELVRFHRPRVEALVEAEPDVLALETVPDVREAEALLTAARGLGVPLWLSYTISGDRTRAGQPLREAFGLVVDEPDVIAVGVNCCTAADAGRAVPLAADVTGLPVVVYPNSGEDYDPARGTWRGPSTYHPELALRWRADGARLVGGCCRVGPDRIAALAGLLSQTP